MSIIFDIYAQFYIQDEPIVNFGWYWKKVPFDALMIPLWYPFEGGQPRNMKQTRARTMKLGRYG